jgi:hypothetical protein
MTLRTNARIAGVTYLLYLVVGTSSLVLGGRTQATELFSVLTSFCALVLGVTLYAITREQDRDLALLGLMCRVIEAIPGQPGYVYFAVGNAIFCWLLLRGRMIPTGLARFGLAASVLLAAVLLLQRARLLGAVTDWSSSITWIASLPVLVFEVAFAGWLLVKGVAPPVRKVSA